MVLAPTLSAALLGLGSRTVLAEEPDDTRLQICPPGGPRLSEYDGVPRVSEMMFINFDGGQMTSGMDHAPSNTTQISECVGSFAAYGGGSKRDATFQAVLAHYEPFDLVITDTRPGGDSYAMGMVGPSNPFEGGVLGISMMDCGDQNPNSVSFSFLSANDMYSASVQGTVIAHEIAHGFGLEHVNDPDDVMNPSVSVNGNPVFKNECIAIVQGMCGGGHAGCNSGQQNDHADLMSLFGPSEPDAGPPTVEITSPSDGDTFEVGADFTITVEADDDKGVVQVDLYNNGAQQGSDDTAPWGWEVENIPEGSYEFHVIAIDEAGNEATSDVVRIEVGAAADDGDGDGEDDGADDGGDEPYEPGGGDLPPGFGRTERDEGCGCVTSPITAGPWLLLLVALPLARRRT